MLDHFGLLSTYLSVIKASHVQPISPFENRVHLDICQSPRSVTNHLAQTWMSTSPGKCEVKSTMGFGGTYFFPNKPHQAPEHEENRKHCQRHLMLRPALRHQESLWLFSMAWVSEAFFLNSNILSYWTDFPSFPFHAVRRPAYRCWFCIASHTPTSNKRVCKHNQSTNQPTSTKTSHKHIKLITIQSLYIYNLHFIHHS